MFNSYLCISAVYNFDILIWYSFIIFYQIIPDFNIIIYM